MNEVDWSTYTTAELIEAYAGLKNKIEEAERNFKKKLTSSKEGLESIHTQINKRMNAAGLTQTAVKGVGLAFYVDRTFYYADDWGKFCDHLIDRIARGDDIISVLAAFQKKPTQEYVTAWMAENKNVPPPGVRVDTKAELQIRRSK